MRLLFGARIDTLFAAAAEQLARRSAARRAPSWRAKRARKARRESKTGRQKRRAKEERERGGAAKRRPKNASSATRNTDTTMANPFTLLLFVAPLCCSGLSRGELWRQIIRTDETIGLKIEKNSRARLELARGPMDEAWGRRQGADEARFVTF